MEVASPLTFSHVQAGTKRRFACSPILDAAMGVESNTDDYAMDDCSHYGHKKRRRFGSSDGFETNQPTTPSTLTTLASPHTSGSHGKFICSDSLLVTKIVKYCDVSMPILIN